MTEKRVQFNNIVQNQLPSYVREEFPLISEFLKQYYLAQEFKGAPIDLIESIDKYIKLEETTGLVDFTVLRDDIDINDQTISASFGPNSKGTYGFPDSYGLLKIGNEVITYTGKTNLEFTGCIRGFVGITSYTSNANIENSLFTQSVSEEHKSGTTIQNLSNLFLKEFLKKTKKQLLPLIDTRSLDPNLNENLFIKQAKNFYATRGTDRSFEILFKALYGKEVSIIKPKDYLFTPSNSDFRITNDLVVEALEGDPLDLDQATLYQNLYEYGISFQKSLAPITRVEKIDSLTGDKNFYVLSLDGGYDRDIDVTGALYGNFKVHPKTKVIGQISAGSSVFTVDSTVGFGQTGELAVKYTDLSVGVVSYTSKSVTEFYGCTNIDGNIENASEVGINTYAFGRSFKDQNEIIKVKINSVLKKYITPDNTRYYAPNDIIRIKSLGNPLADNFRFNNWIYNTASKHTIKRVDLLDSSDNTYNVILNNNHYYNVGDVLNLIDKNNISNEASVTGITSKKSVQIKGQGIIDTLSNYTIQRNISKGISNTLETTRLYSANVQGVYDGGDHMMVTSASIPNYSSSPTNTPDRSVIFSGEFIGEELEITPLGKHFFQTGDRVYYEAERTIEVTINFNRTVTEKVVIGTSLGSEFTEGLYYVKKVNNTTIKLSKSLTNLYNNIFLSVTNAVTGGGPVTITNNKFFIYEFKDKSVNSQKLVRKIPKIAQHTGKLTKTVPGYTGILVNGVEILNYKAKEQINYGKIENIEVLSPGSNYDIISPPALVISDPVGTGATGDISVLGSLREIRVINPGFDYTETPTISITGGNGNGAKVSVNMKLVDHRVSFYSESTSGKVGLGTLSAIGFSTYHKFKNGEKVVYETSGQDGILGLTTNSTYHISSETNTKIKLHKNLSDALAGINTVELTGYGIGIHKFKSFNKKSIIEGINLVSSGTGYENKKKSCGVIGISTSQNKITIKNHDYKSGEIVKYYAGDTPISGLVDKTEYYVVKIDDDSFKLTNVGVSTVDKEFYYKTNQIVNISSVGVGTHAFNYPEIVVTLSEKIGISSIGNETFKASIQPIFRGQVTSVNLTNHGVGYGSSEIINLDKKPQVIATGGEGARVYPVINSGRIDEVFVINSGKNYNSPPDIRIDGDGVGAILTPIMDGNGGIDSIKIIQSGGGYSQDSTNITVLSPGNDANLNANIQSWKINLFQKYFNSISNDDGFIDSGLNEEYGLQYSHIYAPRKLREMVFAVNQEGEKLYGEYDLRKNIDGETESTNHSPIIGWSYDGHPIYGPYGYSNLNGGSITQMKSGYIEEAVLKDNRPPLDIFAPGFFIEDFVYKYVNDESVLDENNGRHCVTPEYPQGTYCYFATIDTSVPDSQEPFLGYKRPMFPYLIGENYHAKPDEFNFKKISNQDGYDLNKTNLIKNTDPYNYFDGKETYDYLSLPNNLNQKVEVKSVYRGGVDSIGILTGGNNYKVNDSLVFQDFGTDGSDAAAKVSKIFGKSVNNISVATSTISNVEIYPKSKNSYLVICDNPHNFRNIDLVSITGITTSTIDLSNLLPIEVSNQSFSLSGIGTTSSGIGTVGEPGAVGDGHTGLVTYFKISGDLSPLNIRENDIVGIGSEEVKVLNVDSNLSRIRVLRAINGVVGVSHTVGVGLTVKQRKFIASNSSGINTTFNNLENKEIYFNPLHTVATGSVGIGTTISIENSSGIGTTTISVPYKTLFIPNHNLKTGDRLTYSSQVGSAISVSDATNVGVALTYFGESFFVAKVSENLIGLSTVRVGLAETGIFVGIASTSITTLIFTGIGTGSYHSLKTNYDVIKGEVNMHLVTVATDEPHELHVGHNVYTKINPGLSSSFSLEYNDFNRNLIINPLTYGSTGINTITSVISIDNHKLVSGQKVVYTNSTNPSIGLVDNGVYYVAPIDENTFKLSETFYGATNKIPNTVGIASTGSGGSINPINPPIKFYRDSIVDINVSSDSLSYTKESVSYSAFEFNLYYDRNFTNKYNGKITDGKQFDVRRTGEPGIDNDAKVSILINEKTPDKLYYRLDPVYKNNIPASKSEVKVDSDVYLNNEILIVNSKFNGKHRVATSIGNSFSYTSKEYPEKSSYSAPISDIKYETDCVHAKGPIAEISIINSGKSYLSLPGITTITSTFGVGAILESSSSSIGKINKTEIKSIGFDLPVDNTLRPTASLPNLVEIKSLKSFNFIGVSSNGFGYSFSPDLVVVDGGTNKVVTDVDLEYKIGNTEVNIINNTKGISNTRPNIIPIHNNNGCGISTIGFNTETNQVTVGLSTGFSLGDRFPVQVGDKVLIENVSVGIGSTARGYNSDAYNYKLFSVIAVDKNLGGVGATFSYSLKGLLKPGELPGKFDLFNSSARVISNRDFPQFKIQLQNNNFFDEEVVTSDNTSGIVESWDNVKGILRISTNKNFKVGELIKGLSSGTQGIASSVTTFDSVIELGPTSKVVKGSFTDSGFLNTNIQRIQDSDYYQNFSYSLKSRVDFDTWNEVISATNHTSGFKKFSDLQFETPAERGEVDANSMKVKPPLSYSNITNSIYGVADLNCVYNFDLVKENSRTVSGTIYSDEIIFSSTILTDYFESFGNRAIRIDDISSQFNSEPRSTTFVQIDSFKTQQNRALKYFVFLRDKRFLAERQLMVVDLLHDNRFGYINQYGRVESEKELGSFDFLINGTDGSLIFYPNLTKFNNYEITSVAYQLDDNVIGIGTTVSLGGVVEIQTSSIGTITSSSSDKTIVSLANTYRSAKVLVCVSDTTNNEYQFDELNLIHDDSEVYMLDYGELTTSGAGPFTGIGFGTYYPYISGTNIKVDFIPTTGIAVTVNTIQVAISSDSSTGIGTTAMKHVEIDARSTNIVSSGSPGIHTISSYNSDYDAAYFIVQISDTTNKRYTLSEVLVTDDDYERIRTYDTEYGMIDASNGSTYTGLGTIGSRILAGGGAELTFTPNAGIAVQAKVYKNALKIEDDSRDEISFENGMIVSNSSEYEGTHVSLMRSFDLKHTESPIFEKYFLANDSSIINLTENVINIPNHFYVSGEAVRYDRNGGITSSVGIAETTFAGAGSTTFLPSNEDIFVIKVDDDKIKLATSAANALASLPIALKLESVGIGTSHRFIAKNQNTKCLVAIDNMIQSPIVSTGTTTGLSTNLTSVSDIVAFSGITSFKGSDLFKINDEIMKIEGIGIGETNFIRVRRGWMGTKVGTGQTGDVVTKVEGNYNIVDNIITFYEAPYGNTPIGTTSSPPDERDWSGISTSSSFQGRVFTRSGIENSANETYNTNRVYDSISTQFNGTDRVFTLKENESSNVTGISTQNAIILINDILQEPGETKNYNLTEDSGKTTISFVGAAASTPTDANTAGIPLGGVLASVGSTEGLGYQPLVSAGGTAIVSSAGTIQSISVANTGSGYRASDRIEILTDVSTSIGIGSTEIYLDNSNSVFNIVDLLLDDSTSCNIAIGTYIQPTPIVSTGNTFVRIGTGGTSSLSMDRGTQVSIVITEPKFGIVNVNAGSTSVGVETSLYHVGIATIIKGTGHISTSVSIANTYSEFYAEKSISNVGYSSITGITTVTTSTAHGLTIGEEIILSGIAFTCTYSPSKTITNVLYDNTSGVTTVTTSAAHEFLVGKDVLLTGIGMTCGLDNGGSTHTYPRTTDPAYCGVQITQILSSTQFVANTGVSTIPTFYQSGGTVQGAIIAPRHKNRSISGTDPASGGSSVLRVINDTTFVTQTGISTVQHFYTRCGKVNKPLNLYFDNPLSYTNIPLEYVGTSGSGVNATVDIIVGQGSSVIDFTIKNTGAGYLLGQKLTVSTGSTTGIPTSGTFNNFELTIQDVLSDEFSAWTLGFLETLDDISDKFDGETKAFNLSKDGFIVSIRSARGSKIDVQQVVIVLVNNILQVPGEGYKFTGGSILTFSEPPKVGDTCQIIFYKGSGDGQDVIFKDTIASVKIGDDLTIGYDTKLGQSHILQESSRKVTRIDSTDQVQTFPYFGSGLSEDETLERPVVWCRQTADLLIDLQRVSKDRELYEPVIHPYAYITKSVGIGSTSIYVDRLRPMFDAQNESDVNVLFQKKVKLVPQTNLVGSSATAVVSDSGTITSLVISNGGVGYSTTPTVSIAGTVQQVVGGGITATASATIASGVVSGLTITNAGTGYTSSKPPVVLISPPSMVAIEERPVDLFAGDSGVIVGFGTTTIGVTTSFIFDLHIPLDSQLRDASIVGVGSTLSGLSKFDYFVVTDSNPNPARNVTSLDNNGNTVGVGTTFVDNVYVVDNVENVMRITGFNGAGVGIGTTVCRRVYVKVDDSFASPYPQGFIGTGGFGSYSWGKIILKSRIGIVTHPAYTQNGVVGISTGLIIERSVPLRSKNYDI